MRQSNQQKIASGMEIMRASQGFDGLRNSKSSRQSTTPGALLAAQGGLITLTLLFGAFVNLLVLTGPIFALQVYDRVLGSRSVETLVALSLLMTFLFLVMGMLDHARKRIASRIGERLVLQLEPMAMFAQPTAGQAATNDLETLRQFFASALFVALMDLVWLPLFVIVLAILHPALGWFCLIGCAAFLIPGIWNLIVPKNPRCADHSDFKQAEGLASIALTAPRMFLRRGLIKHWQQLRANARDTALKAQDQRAFMTSTAQTFRMFLQSATIALGAYLVLQDALTPGAIIAATVLLARTIGPLDMISQNTPTLRAFAHAWRRLSAQHPPQSPTTETNKPEPGLTVDQITVFPPDHRRAALRMFSLDLKPASAIGILGPCGSGKTALANATIGHWPLAGGTIRFGKTPISAMDTTAFEKTVGYLPQNPVFLPGTIGQNISGFCPENNGAACISAAKSTGAHDLITALPGGYDTPINPINLPFSAGLCQRIALARAVFHKPRLLVLDAPMVHLDQDGTDMIQELVLGLKSTGGCAVLLSQNPDDLADCDHVLMLDNGIQTNVGATEVQRPATTPVLAVSKSRPTR